MIEKFSKKISEKFANFRIKSKEKAGGFPLVAWLGIAGMLLILCSELFTGATSTNEQSEASATNTQPNVASTGESAQMQAIEAYRTSLETQLSSLIGQLDGAGKVTVMITLQTSEEVVYATNTQEGVDTALKEHVLLQDGTALPEKTIFPTVAGVAVLCEGGDVVAVEAKITNLISALFNLPTNHISVEKMT